MEKQGPARAGIFPMNIPALRRDKESRERPRDQQKGREQWAAEEGRNWVKFKSERQSNKNNREECAWASKLKRMKFNMQLIRFGSLVSKSENAGTSHFFSPQPNSLQGRG